MQLTAAISIGNEKSSSDAGTLGCFAVTTGGGQVLLSCNHVVFDAEAATGVKIGSPTAGSCRSCCAKNIIADPTTAGRQGNISTSAGQTYVDCAIARLRPGVTGINRVAGLSGTARVGGASVGNLLQGTHAAVQGERVTIATYRRLIRGQITDVNRDIRMDASRFQRRQLLITVDHGFEEDIVFGTGDSGSVVINQHNEIVGLMHSRGTSAVGGAINELSDTILATPIEAILEALTITIPPQAATGGSAGALLEDVPPPPPGEPAITDPELLRYQELVRRSARGTFLHDAGFRHGAEVVHLVHHCRPVTVAWHRSEGPAWAAHFINSARDPTYTVPPDVKGIIQAMLLARMRDALIKHGSDALRQDIADHGAMVMALAGVGSLAQVLQRLEADADLVMVS